MALSGIDRITYGVADLEEGRRFFTDWGLSERVGEPSRLLFETLDGGEIELRRLDDPDLPPAFEEGPTVREVIWGVAATASLEAVVERLRAVTDVETGADGVVRCTDPNGLRVGLRQSRRRAVEVVGAVMNTSDNPRARVDRRSPVYDRAQPLRIGHVVFFTPDLAETEAFYREGLGFRVSDRYPGRGVFLRCQPEGGHHNLFLLRTPNDRRGLNHVAFSVRDIHEVFGGGLHIGRCGWKTEIGPGRHPISSAYFWYVRNPCGGLAEYYADEDFLTADWQPREDWVQATENFAEWAIAGGLDARTRRQYLPE